MTHQNLNKNLMESRFIKSLLILCLFLACSCSNYTKKMWQAKHQEEVFQYFLLSNGGNFVTFLGDEFHYVFFDQYGVLKKLLSFENRDELVINTEQTRLALDRNNNLSGKLVIETLGVQLPPYQARYLQFLGFKRGAETMVLEVEVKGSRYVNNVQFRGNFQKLSLPYRIKISDSGSKTGNVILKTAATPFTLAADIIITIGKIIIFPFTD